MTLTKALIISASLFALGVIVQCATPYPATSLANMEFIDYLYAGLYISGISFVPVSAGISNLIKKFKKK